MIASLIRWRSMRQRLSRRACMRPLVRHGAVSSTFWRARLVPMWNMSRRRCSRRRLLSFDCRPHLPLIAAHGLPDCTPHQVLERFDCRVAEVAMIASRLPPSLHALIWLL